MKVITYRVLQPDELDKLPSEFYKDTDTLKHGRKYGPGDSVAMVAAEEDGKVVGVWAAMLVAHCGPLWIESSKRGSSRVIRNGMWPIVKDAVRTLGSPSALMLAASPAVEHIANELGGERVEGQLYHIWVKE